MIEWIQSFVNPHLDSFTLDVLGKIQCLRTGMSFYHNILGDNPIVSYSGSKDLFSLETQGIWAVQWWEDVEKNAGTGFRSTAGADFPDGNLKIGGLTRSKKWVIVTVNFVGESGNGNEGFERAKDIKIVNSNIKEVLSVPGISPKRFFVLLEGRLEKWCDKRQAEYLKLKNSLSEVELLRNLLFEVPIDETLK